MAVNIIHTPKDIDFTGNPIAYVIGGTRYQVSAGTKAVLKIQKVGTVAPDQNITLYFADYTLYFQAGYDDDTGTRITPYADQDDLVQDFKDNYYIAKYYDVTKESTDIIVLTAKSVGDQYSITIDASSAAGLSVSSNTAGTDAVYNENYKLLSSLMLYDGTDIIKVAELHSEPDEDIRTVVYSGEMMHALLKHDLPAFDESEWQKCNNILRKYYFEFAEYFGNPAKAKKVYYSTERKVLKATIDFDKYQDYDLATDVIANKHYLTSMPNYRETWPSARHFLHVFQPMDTDNGLKLEVTMNYTDGTTDTTSVSTATGGAESKEIYAIPVGIKQLGLDAINSSKTIESYELKVKLTDAPYADMQIGQTVVFDVVQRPVYGRVFLFQNRYGVIDSFLSTAYAEKEAARDSSVGAIRQPYNYSNQHSVLSSEQLATEIWSASSGYKTEEEVRAIAEISSSDYVWMQGKESFIPVVLEKGSLKVIDEEADLHSMEFEFRLAATGRVKELIDESLYRNYEDDYANDYN